MLCRVFVRLSTLYELLCARECSLNTRPWTHADLREFHMPRPRSAVLREIVLRLPLHGESACVGGESCKHGKV